MEQINTQLMVQVLSPVGALAVGGGNPETINVTTDPQAITVLGSEPLSVVQIQQGVPGQQGPPGTGATITALAGATISAGIAVVLIGGLLYPADPTNLSHACAVVGISTTSGTTGNPIDVASAGELDGESYPESDMIMYVGLNGILSINPVALGAVWQMRVGLTKSRSALIIVLQPPINISAGG